MDLLQEIQTSSTRKSPFAEAALQKLLDSNLSAKYALTGCLSKSRNHGGNLDLFYVYKISAYQIGHTIEI